MPGLSAFERKYVTNFAQFGFRIKMAFLFYCKYIVLRRLVSEQPQLVIFLSSLYFIFILQDLIRRLDMI